MFFSLHLELNKEKKIFSIKMIESSLCLSISILSIEQVVNNNGISSNDEKGKA